MVSVTPKSLHKLNWNFCIITDFCPIKSQHLLGLGEVLNLLVMTDFELSSTGHCRAFMIITVDAIFVMVVAMVLAHSSERNIDPAEGSFFLFFFFFSGETTTRTCRQDSQWS